MRYVEVPAGTQRIVLKYDLGLAGWIVLGDTVFRGAGGHGPNPFGGISWKFNIHVKAFPAASAD